MSDLISRSALIELIQSHDDITLDRFSELSVIRVIKEQPTAYDVEGVVAELEHQKEQCEKDMKYYEEKSWKDHISHTNYDLFYAQSDCWEDAIDIVRKGGME